MQVMASQKQIEVKYQQAQKTAVRPLHCALSFWQYVNSRPCMGSFSSVSRGHKQPIEIGYLCG